MIPPATLGLACLHTRVESWECDFNGHWNARHYSRAFQMAAERAATLDGSPNRGMGGLELRVIRFHRELFVGAAVEIRSVRVADGAQAGAVAHLLFSGGRLSATAFDLPEAGGAHLPAAGAEAVALALPRGEVLALAPDESTAGDWTEAGPVRPADLDHTGALLYEAVIQRVGYGLYHLVTGLGLTPAFTRETGIGHMALQSALRPLPAPCPPGTLLRVRSRILRLGRKTFVTRHRLETAAGAGLAEVVHDIATVDLNRRRAVDLPGFLRAP